MSKVNIVRGPQIHRVERGWGYELWVENIGDYCGKILHVEKNKKGSLHYHMWKKETMYVLDGVVQINFIDAETGQEYSEVLYPMDSVLIEPGQAHQICGVVDSNIMEVSTYHREEDTCRIRKGD